MTLSLAFTLKSSNLSFYFPDLTQLNRHNWQRRPHCLKGRLYFESSILSLPSAVINQTNTTTIFHDFSRPTIIFHDFPSLENEFLKFYYFFYDPPEPWAQKKKT